MVAWTRWGGPTGTPGSPAGLFGMLGLGGRLGFWRTTFSPSIVWHRVMACQGAPLCSSIDYILPQHYIYWSYKCECMLLLLLLQRLNQVCAHETFSLSSYPCMVNRKAARGANKGVTFLINALHFIGFTSAIYI